jgi:hypothetical protein
VIRTVVEDGARSRRHRDLAALSTRVMPAFFAIAVVLAIAARWLGLPTVVELSILGVVVAALVGAAIVMRRVPPPTDAVAAVLDADAGQQGELRSAYWFAQSSEQDDWSRLHLERAARKARAIEWFQLHPMPSRGRNLANGAWLAAGLAVAILGPYRSEASRLAQLAAEARQAAGQQAGIPDELQKRLDALLDKMEKGQISPEMARGELANLKDLVSKLTPDMEAALAKMAEKGGAGDKGSQNGPGDPKQLADRAEKAAEQNADMPEDVKWSLKDLAARLSSQDRPPTTGSEGTPGSSATSEQSQSASKNASNDASNMSVQMMRVADAGAC